MTAITLQNLRKEFDDVVAVNGIDLEIRDGEFLVIVGPSGCGKSTTLRLLAGLERMTGGRITMSERDVSGLEPKDRNVAMVFQNYALYPHMTGRRNITFGMKSSGDFTETEIETRVADAAETLDITDLLDRKPEAMSGGERQRVALGRAIVRDPDAFLMDEPLSNLDAKLRIQMRAELAKIHSSLGTTTVYVTHDQTEAMTLGDRVVVMNDGQIMQVNEPQTLYDAPANRFVAEFIGDPAMNMIPVAIEDGNAVQDTFTLPLPAADRRLNSQSSGRTNTPVTDGRRAVLGIRPEDFHLASDQSALDSQTLEATVSVTEPLGNSLLLHCTIGDAPCKVQVKPRTDIQSGDRITVNCDPARLHLFERETGDALYHSAESLSTGDEVVSPGQRQY
jgi:multiple sugar transport system ATP-binding protein